MIDKNTKVFIDIVKAGICGEKATIPKDFNLESLYLLAKTHRIMNLCYHGAVLSGVDESSDAMQKLYKGAVAELIFHEKQKVELEKVFFAFEENKISYMPLKGTVLKSLYKKPEMRTMGDADILIRTEEYERIIEIMQRLGFAYKYESNHEYVWENDRINVELHKFLFPSYTEEFYIPYKNIWSKAIRTETEYKYRLSNEDEFVYAFTHFVKHYKLGGIGVNHLCDLWILLQTRKLDIAVIDSQLKKLWLTEFYENIRNTLSFWFENGEEDNKVELITKTIIKNCAFGTKKSFQAAFAVRISEKKNPYKKRGKIIVLMFKVFPAARFLTHKYPFLIKKRWLLPVAWAHRWFDALFLHRKRIKNGINAIKNTDESKVIQTKKEFLEVGIRFNYMED